MGPAGAGRLVNAGGTSVASGLGVDRGPARRAAAGLARLGWGALARFGVLIALVLLWEVAATAGDSIFFPPPSEIVGRLQELWLSGDPPTFMTDAVGEDVVPSLARMFAGWSLAAVAGVTLGVAIGRSRFLSDVVEPPVHFLRSVPGPALIPIFLILLGTDATMRIALIAFGSVWPVLLNTIDGVRSVEPVQLETARVFGLRRGAQLRRVVLPAALPKIFAGLRVAVSIALILMVISELVAATDGIGHQLDEAQRTFLLSDMWAGILLLALLGYVLNLVFETVERRALAWHRGARRR